MVKKVFSFLPVNKGRTMKKRGGKKGLLSRVLHYLKSDDYMYAPLVSSKNPSFISFTGVEENEKSKKNEPKKLVDKVIKYLLSDCYMYAPFVSTPPRLCAGVRRNSKNEPKKFLDKVKKYLLSDCYMYAPLLLDEPRLCSGVPEIEIGKSENEPKKLVDKVKKYMLSDCYMYAPLFLDEPQLCAVQEKEYPENKSNKLVDKVKEYMVSDCYMYAPLLLDQPWLRAGSMSSSEIEVDPSRQGDATKSVTLNAIDARQNTKSTSISNQRVAEYPLTRKTIIKNTLLQRETVEQVIQEDGDPPSVKGNEKQEKWRKKRTKLSETSAEDTKRRRKVAAK